MKFRLKQLAWLSFGIVGAVAIANATLQPRLAVAEDSSNSPIEAAQTAEIQAIETMPAPESIAAQAPSNSVLIAEQQNKPTIVKIYADWCAACQRLRPITAELQQRFNRRANFVIFDVTDRRTTQEAEARARELGLSNFLAAHRAQTSTVAVIDPSSGQILEQFRYNFNEQDYINAINEAIAQTSRS